MNYPRRERRPERPSAPTPTWIKALFIVVMSLGALWLIIVIVGIILLIVRYQ